MEIPIRPFYYRLSLILLMLFLIAITLFYGRDIIIPFAFATLLAILLTPLNNFLENRKVSRPTAIVLSLAVSFLFIFGIIYFLSIQILAFLDDMPIIRERMNELIYSLQRWLHQRFGLSMREQTNYINTAKEGGSGILGDTFLSITDILLGLTLLPIYTFLILYYRNMLKKFIITVFKDGNREKVEDVLRESKGVVQNYMVGLLIEMGIVAVINFIGFAIIGIEYAIFLAVFAAILNLIPYIGMLIASFFCSIVTLTTSDNTTDAIWTLLVLWIVQFFDNNIIMPRVVGSKVKINAMITILGVLIGGALCGIPGMFLSIPGIAILKVIFERVDNLKPWGMLLSDDITSNQPGRIYSSVTRLRRKPPLKS
jgi:predicted PurR-regulated permease PerM